MEFGVEVVVRVTVILRVVLDELILGVVRHSVVIRGLAVLVRLTILVTGVLVLCAKGVR